MRSGQTAVDVVANNLANVNTTSFRRSRVAFRDELSTRLMRPAAAADGTLPQVGTGVNTAAILADVRPGSLDPTGHPLHLAITGDGFFTWRSPAGDVLYGRDGTLGLDSRRRLVYTDGSLLLDDRGRPIRLPDWSNSFAIAADGTVTAHGDDQDEEVATVGLVRFANPTGLESVGNNLFAATVASGDPERGVPGTAGFGTLQQGALERSNVDVAEEMAALMLAQRAFQLNARVIQTTDEMMALANRLTG